MRRKTAFLATAVLIAAFFRLPSQTTADDWKPDPAILPKLGSMTMLGPYAMRLPVGYEPVNPTPAIAAKRPKAEVAVVYASPDKHPSGESAALGIAIVTISRDVTSAAMITEGLREALQYVVTNRRRAALTWTNGKEERGSMSGLPLRTPAFFRNGWYSRRNAGHTRLYLRQRVWAHIRQFSWCRRRSLRLMYSPGDGSRRADVP